MRRARRDTIRRALICPLAVVALLALGCAPLVQVAFDERADFATFRTWDWDPRDTPSVVAPERSAARIESRLSRLIESGFRLRGYPRGAASPNFRVAYQVSMERRREVVGVARAPYLLSSMSYSPSYWIEGTDAVERSFDHLQLLIEAVDPSGRVVWKGGVQRRVEEGQPFDFEEAVGLLLERFPRAQPPPPTDVHADQVALVSW